MSALPVGLVMLFLAGDAPGAGFLGQAEAAQAAPESPAKTVGDRQAAELTKLCRDDTAGYVLTYANDNSAKFEVKEVMKWTNPVRDGQIGVVSIWLKDGRAQALSTVFANPLGAGRFVMMHEFQSLATQLLTARRNGESRWAPRQAGATFRPIPDAPEPAETPAARLRQMRSLIRDFSAHSVSYYRGEQRWELRMLTQPLHRYEGSEKETLDGALFTFVSSAGTDPELLLLVEARKSGAGWAWQYAPARFSDHSLHLNFRDKEVWTFINQERNSSFAAGLNDSYRLFDDRTISDASLSPEAAR